MNNKPIANDLGALHFGNCGRKYNKQKILIKKNE